MCVIRKAAQATSANIADHGINVHFHRFACFGIRTKSGLHAKIQHKIVLRLKVVSI